MVVQCGPSAHSSKELRRPSRPMLTDSQYAMLPRADQGKDFVYTRRLIFLYCFLWIIEGALRKWVVPSLSMPLLVIRDPVALAIYYFAARARVFPVNGWMTFVWGFTALIVAQAVFQASAGSVSWAVAAYGTRCYVLHLPLIWVIPAVFGRKEIVTLGKWALFLALPMALLMVVQFQVGPDHWLNAATLKGGAQISASFGRVRPPGLFSFIEGPIRYYALCTAFSIAGFLMKGTFPRWLAIAGLAATLVAMSVSASRGLALGSAVVAAFGVIAAFRSGKTLGAAIVVGILVVVVFGLISRSETIQEGVAAFTGRWVEGDEVHGTGRQVMASRFGAGFTSAFEWASRGGFLGEGVGVSTNLAGSLVGGRDAPVEGEWERIIYEVGPITGFLYLGWRTALAAWIIALGWRVLRAGNYVCLLLGSACFLDVLSGFTKQPTALGYIGMCAGLTLASARAFSSEASPELTPEPQPDLPRRPKGRSPYAEQLHGPARGT